MRRPCIMADMSSLESEARIDRKRGYIQDAVLATLMVTGICAWIMIAPNTMRLLRYVNNVPRFNYRTKSAVNRLIQKGMIRFVVKGDSKYLEITQRGRQRFALEMEKEALRERSKGRWDKRYRMVIFDIPERRRLVRDRLRRTMIDSGFLRIQDSVWVSPYDCEELIILIKAQLRIGKDVLYTIVEKIENDRWIRKHFNI
jgi:CRISPR-associated endonuclease Cas2